MSALAHAEKAAEMLDAITSYEQRMADATEEEKLQMVATGGISRFNADQKWTCELAVAHALTSLALATADGVRWPGEAVL